MWILIFITGIAINRFVPQHAGDAALTYHELVALWRSWRSCVFLATNLTSQLSRRRANDHARAGYLPVLAVGKSPRLAHQSRWRPGAACWRRCMTNVAVTCGCARP